MNLLLASIPKPRLMYNKPMSRFKEIITTKKYALEQRAAAPLRVLAEKCAPIWHNAEQLDRTLHEGINTLPDCNMIYAVNTKGTLISANIESDKLDTQWRGLDLAGRPYLNNPFPEAARCMSTVYTSRLNTQPTLTLMHRVMDGNKYLGFIAADFSVEELPKSSVPPPRTANSLWQQYKGDPAIRGTLFLQERAISAMDKVLDEVTDLIIDMMQHKGVFHTKIHYSSSRVSFWSVDDPYDYQIHTIEELTDPDVCLAYPQQPMFERVQVSEQDIKKVLKLFQALRNADETVYLRSSSFNLINGMVGLTFSCDGSHYLHYEEFIEKGSDFWFGVQSEMRSA